MGRVPLPQPPKHNSVSRRCQHHLLHGYHGTDNTTLAVAPQQKKMKCQTMPKSDSTCSDAKVRSSLARQLTGETGRQ